MSDKQKDDFDTHFSIPCDDSMQEKIISIEAELPDDGDFEEGIEPASVADLELGVKESSENGPEVPRHDEESPNLSGGEQNKPPVADRSFLESGKGSPRLVIAMASGKGGVGKSLLAASVGVYLAQLGKQVMLVDGNLGSGNLHTLLGVEEPNYCLHKFLWKEFKRIEEVVAKTPFRGLGLVPSRDNAVGATNPRPAQKNRLLSQIRSLVVDYAIIDLPAGSDFNTVDFFLAADLHIVVVVPEPTAIESAFRLIKCAFIRKVRSVKGVDRLIIDLQASSHCGIPTPNQIYEMARERDPEMGKAIHKAMAEFKPRLLVNMTRTRDDLELGPSLAEIGQRHLGLPFDYLGYVENEDVAWVTVRKRRPLLVEYPEAKVAKDIERVTRRIISLETKEPPECMGAPVPLARQGHYKILGLHPGATDEEVRRAHRRVRRIYSPDSLAIYGIVPPAELNKMHSRLEEAYATLVDPEKRHLYDQKIFSGGGGLEDLSEIGAVPLPRQDHILEPHGALPLGERPKMPVVDETTQFTGTLLRQIREARGVELQDISDRTKISIVYLRAIEEENFLATPASVYLRGFVKAVARDLKLNSERVAQSYMERYEEAQRH